MSDDKERRHCEAVAVAVLKDHAVARDYVPGIFDCVAFADIAELVKRERAAAREQALEVAVAALVKRGHIALAELLHEYVAESKAAPR